MFTIVAVRIITAVALIIVSSMRSLRVKRIQLEVFRRLSR